MADNENKTTLKITAIDDTAAAINSAKKNLESLPKSLQSLYKTAGSGQDMFTGKVTKGGKALSDMGRMGIQSLTGLPSVIDRGAGALASMAMKASGVAAALETARRGYMQFAQYDTGMRRLQNQIGGNRMELEKFGDTFRAIRERTADDLGEIQAGFKKFLDKSKIKPEQARQMFPDIVKYSHGVEAGIDGMSTIVADAMRSMTIPTKDYKAVLEATSRAADDFSIDMGALAEGGAALEDTFSNMGYKGADGYQRMVTLIGLADKATGDTRKSMMILGNLMEKVMMGDKGIADAIGIPVSEMMKNLEEAKKAGDPMAYILSLFSQANDLKALSQAIGMKDIKVARELQNQYQNIGKEILKTKSYMEGGNKSDNMLNGAQVAAQAFTNSLVDLVTEIGHLLDSIGGTSVLKTVTQFFGDMAKAANELFQLIDALFHLKLPNWWPKSWKELAWGTFWGPKKPGSLFRTNESWEQHQRARGLDREGNPLKPEEEGNPAVQQTPTVQPPAGPTPAEQFNPYKIGDKPKKMSFLDPVGAYHQGIDAARKLDQNIEKLSKFADSLPDDGERNTVFKAAMGVGNVSAQRGGVALASFNARATEFSSSNRRPRGQEAGEGGGGIKEMTASEFKKMGEGIAKGQGGGYGSSMDAKYLSANFRAGDGGYGGGLGGGGGAGGFSSAGPQSGYSQGTGYGNSNMLRPRRSSGHDDQEAPAEQQAPGGIIGPELQPGTVAPVLPPELGGPKPGEARPAPNVPGAGKQQGPFSDKPVEKRNVNYFQRRGDQPLHLSGTKAALVNTPQGKASAHPEAARDFANMAQQFKDAGAPIKKWGSYNPRKKRWSNDWSSHAYASSWDIGDQATFDKDPAMRAWIKANPEKFKEILRQNNMRQPLADKSMIGGKDAPHIEWTGPGTDDANKPAYAGAGGQAIPGLPKELQAAAAAPTAGGTASGDYQGRRVNADVLKARIQQSNTEWMKDPKNQQKIYRTLQAEGSDNITANLEQMSNYAASRGKTLEQVVNARGSKQFYGPLRRFHGDPGAGPMMRHERDAYNSPWTDAKQKAWDKASKDVFSGGSNKINYATDQGTDGDPNYNPKTMTNVGGNMFGVQPGTGKWVSAQRGKPQVDGPVTTVAEAPKEEKVAEAKPKEVSAEEFKNMGAQPRAAGGPVNRGSPYMVGEHGPEMFSPSMSGQIYPNSRDVNLNFRVQDREVQFARASMRRQADREVRETRWNSYSDIGAA